MNGRIYLNNAVAAIPLKGLVDHVRPYIDGAWASPGDPYLEAEALHRPTREAFRSIYECAEASVEDHFVLTSCGEEAVAQAILATYLDCSRESGRTHFVTSQADEAATIMAFERLHPLGASSTMAELNSEGEVTAAAIANAITPRTALISLSWANALTGVINPVEEIAELCRDRGILLHLDATQVVGKTWLDTQSIQPDLLSFNGEQLHAGRGVGGLFVKKGCNVGALIPGGGEAGALRGGRLNVPALMALSLAAEEAVKHRDHMCTEIARLRGSFEERVLERIEGAEIAFQGSERLPHVSCLLLPGVTSEAVLFGLDQEGVIATRGGGGLQEISWVLKAAGIAPERAHGGVSFALSRYTTQEEIDYAIEVLVKVVSRLRKLSVELVGK
jgi:cysteine desulfurase